MLTKRNREVYQSLSSIFNVDIETWTVTRQSQIFLWPIHSSCLFLIVQPLDEFLVITMLFIFSGLTRISELWLLFFQNTISSYIGLVSHSVRWSLTRAHISGILHDERNENTASCLKKVEIILLGERRVWKIIPWESTESWSGKNV